jgi:hypothetical protein
VIGKNICKASAETVATHGIKSHVGKKLSKWQLSQGVASGKLGEIGRNIVRFELGASTPG